MAHRFVLGTYALLGKIREAYPDIMIEGCSGGGGRFDAGMLFYSPQIWCSDNSEAINRLKIQEGTCYGYPVSTVGSHVSASPNHQNGREVPIATRAIVAMSGTFGYELDPRKLSDDEKREIREQIDLFNGYYSLIQNGDYFRISDEYTQEYLLRSSTYERWTCSEPHVWGISVHTDLIPVLRILCGCSKSGYARITDVDIHR